MPIYAYRCDSCGVDKDVLQKFSDAPLTVCPECGAREFHKRLSAPAFQLKGSGWYVTDFRDGGKKPEAGKGAADAGADAATPAGDAPGSDPKPAESKQAAPKSGDAVPAAGGSTASAAAAPATPAPGGTGAA